jgi:hypothetical protein
MSKKLTLADIKNENKVYEQKKRIELSDDFHVFIYPHFSPSKIAELIKEMITDQQRATEAGLNFDKINMGDWFLFNIIYKFADLGIPSEIKKKVQAFTYIIDSKYFEQIINAFPEESIKKVNDAFLRFKENFDLLMKENGLVNDETIDELLEKENIAQ